MKRFFIILAALFLLYFGFRSGAIQKATGLFVEAWNETKDDMMHDAHMVLNTPIQDLGDSIMVVLTNNQAQN